MSEPLVRNYSYVKGRVLPYTFELRPNSDGWKDISGCWSEVAAYYHKVGESDLNCVCFKNELWCPARSRTSIQDQRSQKIIFKPLNLQGIAGGATTSTINSVLILIQVIRRVQLLPRINISHQSYQEMLFNNGNLPTNSYHR